MTCPALSCHMNICFWWSTEGSCTVKHQVQAGMQSVHMLCLRLSWLSECAESWRGVHFTFRYSEATEWQPANVWEDCVPCCCCLEVWRYICPEDCKSSFEEWLWVHWVWSPVWSVFLQETHLHEESVRHNVQASDPKVVSLIPGQAGLL